MSDKNSASQPEEQPASDQASVRTREEQISALVERILSGNGNLARLSAEAHITEAEKRGDTAGYARRVAEEDGESVAVVMGHFMDGSPILRMNEGFKGLPLNANIYATPQPDTRDETIAKLTAKVATLREALKWIAESVPFFDGAMSLRRRAGSTLAATGDE